MSGTGVVRSGSAANTDVRIRPGRIWTIATTGGFAATGYLPEWAEDNPSNFVALDRLSPALADISHRSSFDGQRVRVGFGSAAAEEAGILSGIIRCTPYAEAPSLNVPVVDLLIVDDWWVTDLDPQGLAEIAALLRAQADRIDHEVRPALAAAREDWAAHQPDGPEKAKG